MELSAVIVDDELHGRENLEILLKKYCPQIKVKAKASNALDGINIINDIDPDVLFLDIQMPELNGFEMLTLLEKRNFSIIFVTAFAKFAIKAIKIQALDYVLKPINPDELKQAVNKAITISKTLTIDEGYSKIYKNAITEAIKNSENQTTPNTITLNLNDGLKVLLLKDIVRLEANGNYTNFILINKEQYVASKSLKHYTEILNKKDFIHCHKSHLVNFNFIKECKRSPEAHLILSDGSIVQVARRRVSFVIEQLKTK